MAIPIQNIYYMFCYAWGHFPAGSQIDVGGEVSPDLKNLFAQALVRGTNHLLRRGLDRHYVQRGEDTKHPRGRIEFGETIKRSLRRTGRLHCLVDELDADILANQIIKTTVSRLRRLDEIDPNIRHDLAVLIRRLEGISEIRLTRSDFRRVQLRSNNAFYRFLIRLCELLYDALLPVKGGQGYRFDDLLKDEVRMSAVFEAFVRNFYLHEQTKYRLGSRRIEWDVDWASEDARSILPSMENDIRLDSPDETIVIDTKYYKGALVPHYQRDILRSAHLYQIFAYVRNLAPRLGSDRALRGILLYPAVGDKLDAEMSVQGHPIRIYTINLDQEWQHIHRDLIDLLEYEPQAD